MKKKLQSIALAAAMCLSLLPATALAAEPVSPDPQASDQAEPQAAVQTEITLNQTETILYLRQNEDNSLSYSIKSGAGFPPAWNSQRIAQSVLQKLPLLLVSV